MSKKTLCMSLSVVCGALIVLSGSVRAQTTPVFPALRSAEPSHGTNTHPGAEKASRILARYGQLPLYFIENMGQVDSQVKYYVEGLTHKVFVTKEGIYLSWVEKPEVFLERERRQSSKHTTELSSSQKLSRRKEIQYVRLFPSGMSRETEIVPGDKHKGKINYLVGRDPKQWRTNVSTYQSLIYRGIYPDIDLKVYGNASQIEYDIVVGPKADPSMVVFSCGGVNGLSVNESGDLLMEVKEGFLLQKRPVVYQDIEGHRVSVDGRYRIYETEGLETGVQFAYGFDIGNYHPEYPLIIDPVLVYSTYLGGANGQETGYAIALDSSNNAYVAGTTTSTDFPTVGPYDAALGDAADAFVTKLNAAGDDLVYSTYLGGTNGSETAYAIVLDSSNNAYVAGTTSSTDFPTVGAYDAALGDAADAFVTKLNAAGDDLVYSTYLGGTNGSETAYAIVLDSSNNVYVAGTTSSTNFPTVGPYDGALGDAADAFVTKLNAAGDDLTYSTYLGGTNGSETAYGIALDSSNNAYVAGTTTSTDFPTVSADDTTLGDAADAFVTKLNAAGDDLVYSTYLGGTNGLETAYGIALDSSNNAYVAGTTTSDDFPTVGAYDSTLGDASDAFVTKLNAVGNNLVYSTYLGGANGSETAYGIALDGSYNVYVVGNTDSTDFPIQDLSGANPFDNAIGGASDAFVTKLNASGSALVFSTYLGGDNGGETAHAIVLDGSEDLYMTGTTFSNDFPTMSAYDEIRGDASDAFVTKFTQDIDTDDGNGEVSGSSCFIGSLW